MVLRLVLGLIDSLDPKQREYKRRDQEAIRARMLVRNGFSYKGDGR